MPIFLIVFLFLGLNSFAQESGRYSNNFDVMTDIISEEYEAGPWLIYDCEKKNWVCVMEEFSKNCEEKREKEKKDPELLRHSCANVGSFPNKKSCFQRQLYLTTHHHGSRFCVKEEWKQKAN